MNLPPIAVLAGGLATRLRPITETIPKSLVAVAGEPFIAHQLRLIRRQGFARAVLLTGHLGDQVEDFVGDGRRFGLSVEYARDGDVARGTGGAVRNALSLLGEQFFLIYGDSYLPIDALPVWNAYCVSGCPALMTVLHNRDAWDPSNALFDGRLVRRHDKTLSGQPGIEWIDYGMSVFAGHVVREWPQADPFDLSRLTGELARRDLLAGFEVRDRFYEIGKPEALGETETYLASQRSPHSSGDCSGPADRPLPQLRGVPRPDRMLRSTPPMRTVFPE